MTDPLIDRVRKLLSLASNNPSENEAAAAAAKAQELMTEYGVTLAQVAIAENKADTITADYTRIDVNTRPQWRVDLASAVARGMNGKMVYTPWKSWAEGSIYFFAPKGTVESMVEIFRYLDLQLSLRSSQALAEAKASDSLGYEYNEWGEYKQVHGKKWRNSWLLGAVSMIGKRFRDNQRDQREASDTSTALVVIRNAVDDKMNEVFPELGKGRARNTDINSGAWSAGRQAGAGMDLGGKQVRGGNFAQLSA